MKQTSVTNNISKIAKTIEGHGLIGVANILDWLTKTLPTRKPGDWRRYFCTRTADRIIEDGFSTGCNDTAVVFVALASAMGYSTVYIEAIDWHWLNGDSADLRKIKGHAFVETIVDDGLDGQVYLVDPESKKICVDVLGGLGPFRVAWRGRDVWDIGINSIETLTEKYLEFKENYSKAGDK